MIEHDQQAGEQTPVRFGAQLLPPLGQGRVSKVVCGLVGDRPQVAITCVGDRSVGMWGMDDHRLAGRPIKPRGHRAVWGVAYGELHGRHVAVLVGGGLWVWHLSERWQLGHAQVHPHPPGRRAGGGQ